MSAVDLSVVAMTVESLVEREVGRLSQIEELNSYQIKDLEVLSKMLTVCIERRKSFAGNSWAQGVSLDDLEKEFE